MSFYDWRPYVSVAERRRRAERDLAKLRKKGGRAIAPVKIEGREIACSFWGKSWCLNLERYSDYENRLPRGRTYVRNGSVLDLQIAKGAVEAMVAGTSLYSVSIAVAPVATARWKSICRDCAGTVDSLIELLQGRLAKAVMDRVCREGDGLFPSPAEITLACSCPDWAGMCKHVAATLYGVGARLDQEPRLLFVLRDVDESELIAGAGADLSLTKAPADAAKVLADDDVAALFGLDMADGAPAPDATIPAADAPAPARRRAKSGEPSAEKKKPAAAKPGEPSGAARASPGGNVAAKAGKKRKKDSSRRDT